MRLLPSARTLDAAAPKLAGLAAGIAVPLILAGVFLAVMGGGLSDNPAPPPPVYPAD